MAATGPRPGGELAGPSESDVARFVADAMLGRLARWLRALGYDTLYLGDASDARLLGVALREGRRLLTRDAALARRARAAGLLVRSVELDAQLEEVVRACGLRARAPMSRCLVCNGALVAAPPEAVRDRVPPYTFATQSRFWRCGSCGQVFWSGTHADGILRRLRPYLPVTGLHADPADGREADRRSAGA